MEPPNVSAYAVTTSCRLVALKCRSRPIVGSETLTILWPCRIGVRVMEHLERTLALAYRKLECLTRLRVGDRYRHVAVVPTPQKPHVDPVACAPVEFACDVGVAASCRLLPGRVIATR